MLFNNFSVCKHDLKFTLKVTNSIYYRIASIRNTEITKETILLFSFVRRI